LLEFPTYQNDLVGFIEEQNGVDADQPQWDSLLETD